MAGHMGAKKITTQNLEVVSADEETGLILVKGAVPGARGGWVTINDAIKKPFEEKSPFPAAIKTDKETPDVPSTNGEQVEGSKSNEDKPVDASSDQGSVNEN